MPTTGPCFTWAPSTRTDSAYSAALPDLHRTRPLPDYVPSNEQRRRCGRPCCVPPTPRQPPVRPELCPRGGHCSSNACDVATINTPSACTPMAGMHRASGQAATRDVPHRTNTHLGTGDVQPTPSRQVLVLCGMCITKRQADAVGGRGLVVCNKLASLAACTRRTPSAPNPTSHHSVTRQGGRDLTSLSRMSTQLTYHLTGRTVPALACSLGFLGSMLRGGSNPGRPLSLHPQQPFPVGPRGKAPAGPAISRSSSIRALLIHEGQQGGQDRSKDPTVGAPCDRAKDSAKVACHEGAPSSNLLVACLVGWNSLQSLACIPSGLPSVALSVSRSYGSLGE